MKVLSAFAFMLAVTASCYAEEFAIIGGMQCRAQWKRSQGDPADAYVGLRLHPGDSVACKSPGYLLLVVYGRRVRVTGKDGWYLIPQVRPLQLTVEEEKREEALQTYLRRGGRERSVDGWASVSPRYFDLFFSFGESGPLSISIRAGQNEIWNDTVSEASGVIKSERARQALSEYQQSGGGLLTLVLRKGDKQDEIPYRVLSRKEEAEVEQHLAGWEKEESAFMGHIGRAFVLDEVGLYEAAANEYQGALQDAPGAEDVLRAAIWEYESAGDHAHARALRSLLTK